MAGLTPDGTAFVEATRTNLHNWVALASGISLVAVICVGLKMISDGINEGKK